MRDVFIPLESFFHSEELQGHVPAWDPAVSYGFPVIASAQIGFFYPILFVLRLFPIWLELPLALVLHVALLATGTFLFAKKLGMSKHASILTAISFSLSQFVWQHITHLNIFLAIAWLPWQMLAMHSIMQRKKISARDTAALILLLGIPFLIGQIQVPFLMMVVAMIYGLYILFSHPLQLPLGQGERTLFHLLTKSGSGKVIQLAIIAFGVFLLVAVQLFPTFELAKLSSRGSGGAFDITNANQFSYPLYHLPTLLFPRFYGNDSTYWGKRLEIEYGFYIGVIPLILAIWFIWNRKKIVMPDLIGHPRGSRLGGRDDTSFFLWLAAITFLLALGSLSPFRLLHIEPSLWIFSAPARWLLFTTFSLSIFAGYGFDAVWNHLQIAKKFFQRIAFTIISLVVISNIFLFVPALTPSLSPIGERGNAKLESMLVSARSSSVSFRSPYTYIAIISLILLPLALRHANGKRIIIAVAACDLIIITYTTTPTLPWQSILKPPVSIQQLPSNVFNHNARVYSIRDGGDTGAYFTDPSSRANMTIRELQKNLLVPMVSAQFNIYGIEWPASLNLTEQAKQLEQLHPTKPYAIENIALAKELNIGAVLSSDMHNEVNVTALETKPRFELSNGSVALISEKPSELILKTNAQRDSTLIIRDTFYPGWHAYVDGNEVPIQKSPLFFRTLQVPAGEHTILMNYQPKVLQIGEIISLGTACTVCFLLLRKKVIRAIIEP